MQLYKNGASAAILASICLLLLTNVAFAQAASVPCSVTSVGNVYFNSGSTGTLNVTVQSQASATTNCGVSVVLSSPLYSTPSGLSYNISAGQTHEFQFAVGSNSTVTQNTTVVARVIACDVSTGIGCQPESFSIYERAACPTGSALVNGVCTPVSVTATVQPTVQQTVQSTPTGSGNGTITAVILLGVVVVIILIIAAYIYFRKPGKR